MTVKIKGDELILSPRITNHALALAEWVDSHGEFSPRIEAVFMATMVSQSLKATSKSYGFRFWKRIKYLKYTPQYIMAKVSHVTMTDIFWKVDEIEGGNLKKKTLEMASQSQETKQSI